MELRHIHHEEFGVTPETINETIVEMADDEHNNVYESLLNFWALNKMPEGLQCVEMHEYVTMKDYVVALLEARLEVGDPRLTDPKFLLQCALIIDNMID